MIADFIVRVLQSAIGFAIALLVADRLGLLWVLCR